MFLYNDILTLLRQLLCCLFLSERFCLTACKGKNNSTICSGVGCGRSKIGSFLFCDLWVGVRASGTWELIPQLSTSLCEKPTPPDVVTVYCCVVVQLCAKKTSRCSKPRTLLPCLHFGQLAAWHSLQPRIRVPSPNLQQCALKSLCLPARWFSTPPLDEAWPHVAQAGDERNSFSDSQLFPPCFLKHLRHQIWLL